MKSKNVIPLKKLKIVEQGQAGMCGAAALRILLSYFKIYKNEGGLSRLCKATKRGGIRTQMMVAALRKLGFEIKTGTWGSKERCWRTLNYWINRRNLPVLVDWFSKDDGHYSVSYRLTRKHIWLADPEFHRKKDRKRKMGWDDFFRVWFDFEGEYIQRLSDLEVRWWLVAYPAPLKIFSQH